MKRKKYLPLYYKWMKNGCLPNVGLCHSFKDSGLGYSTLMNEFFIGYEGAIFWVQNDNNHFNDIRQNIMLLMAAMNGEL